MYVFKTSVSKVAVATFDDMYSEEAYAVSTIHSANVGHSLVYDAVERFQQLNPNMQNPFRKLAEDREAMQKLNDMLASIFYRGE